MKFSLSIVSLIIAIYCSSCYSNRCTGDDRLPEDIFLEFRIVDDSGKNLLTGSFEESGEYNIDSIKFVCKGDTLEYDIDWKMSCGYSFGIQPFTSNFFSQTKDITIPDDVNIFITLPNNDIDTLSMEYHITDNTGCGFYELNQVHFSYNNSTANYQDPCFSYKLTKK